MGGTPKRGNGGRGWLRRWNLLACLALPLLLSLQLGARAVPASAPAPKDQARYGPPAWITLDGRKVLEIRVAAGA